MSHSSMCSCRYFILFFFQAEDGIRDESLTGVQTCALPIFLNDGYPAEICACGRRLRVPESAALANSSVAIHRLRDQAKAGRVMCWMPLQARAEQWPGRRWSLGGTLDPSG